MPLDLNRAFIPVQIALATISDTRALDNDKSGDILAQRIKDAGHILFTRTIIIDDIEQIKAWLQEQINNPNVDVILTTGGTGVTGRDLTPEAVMAVSQKEIPGFGEYFRYISIAKIASSTIQSRAVGAVANGTYIFALPGSPGACKDGWDEILIHQLDSRHRPCNFVELMPRLTEK